MIRLMRITGDSMSPEYQDGDFVFLMNIFRGRIKRGDVIVFRNRLYGRLIKCVENITDDGVYVVGTADNSLDSRRLGPVNPDAIQGRVIWHIHR